MSDLQKAVEQLRTARMEAWRRMAQKLPDHHILSVELFRTEDNETLAVFTVVRNHKPFQQVLRANSRGVNVKAVIPKHRECKPVQVWPLHEVEAVRLEAMALEFTAAGTGDVTAAGIALGEPPPKQEPEPGIISLGTVMLPSAFDVGERLASEGQEEDR